MKAVILAVLVLCSAINVLSQSTSSWAIIDNDFATIALANSFYADNNGYVAGGTSSGSPLLLLTTNGGHNFTNQNLLGNNHAAFLSIDMYDGQNGIAGALGFAGLFACGAYTHDGHNWNSTHNDLICALQDSQAIDANNMVMIGEWSNRGDFEGNGVIITTDGGKTFSENNWGLPSSIGARYAWFQSADLGYVAGGSYPDTASNIESSTHRRLTQNLLLNKLTGKLEVDVKPRSQDVEGYTAVIALATNAATQFTTLVNLTGDGIYFNEISCTDENNCWATAEGVDKTGDVAYIISTTDGWKTYDTQLTVQGGSLVTIDMLTPTFGWAGGALLQTNTEESFEGQFWVTTDGVNWTLNYSLKNFYVFYLTVTSESYAYASGITPIGLSSFASYSPDN